MTRTTAPTRSTTGAAPAVLIAATVTTGLMAGVFWVYSAAVLPGLARTDDRTFVAVFGAIDEALVTPWFLGFGFFGALVWTALAALLHRRRGRAVLLLTGAALGLYLLAFFVTVVVHVPLNDGLRAAGAAADPAAVRGAFDEARWTRWNDVRALATTASCACLAVAAAVGRPGQRRAPGPRTDRGLDGQG